MKILAIGAHFDDVEIGCGGMLLKRVDQGDSVTILTITHSEYSVPNNNLSRSAEIAKEEARKAADMIGAELICVDKDPLVLSHNEKLVYEIESVIETNKPDMVLAHWGGDFHSDHAAVSLCSIRAARRVNNILLYRSNWYHTETLFNGNHYVDISGYVERKLEMIKIFKSVLKQVNYSWIEFIHKQNQYEGSKIGVNAAECFQCIKYVE